MSKSERKQSQQRPKVNVSAENKTTNSAENDLAPIQRAIPASASNQGLRQKRMLKKQRLLGNKRTVQRMKNGVVQRVPIGVPREDEHLLQQYDNNRNPTQDYHEHTYGVGSVDIRGNINDIAYDMSRSPSGVVVTVRIKFVTEYEQPDDHPWIPFYGDNPATPVPEGPARDWARTTCSSLVGHWNNKFKLSGEEVVTPPVEDVPAGVPDTSGAAGPSETTRNPVNLPLSFRAIPVFDVDSDAHHTVRLHASTIADASTGARAITAGDWFVNKNNTVYPSNDDVIYAHEYGHLLGIPDEYSLANPEMHALFHDMSPSRETQMNNALDKAGVKAMVLAALRPRITSELNTAATHIAASIGTQQEIIAKKIAGGLRQQWRDPAVFSAVEADVRNQLVAAGQSDAAAALEQALRFQTRTNFSNISIANRIVPPELAVGQIRSILQTAFTQTISAAQNAAGNVTIPYLDSGGGNANSNVRIDVAPSASNASSPMDTAADAMASQGVGQALAGPVADRPIPLYPSSSLIERIHTVASGWDSVANLMDAQLTNIGPTLSASVTTALAASDISTMVNDNVGDLYRALFQLVQNVSEAAAQTAVRDFLAQQIQPLMDNQISDITSWVDSEVDHHQTATGTGTTANPNLPPDPQIATAVQQISTQARQMLDTTSSGNDAAPQHVRFTMGSLMGNNNVSSDIRTDQFDKLVEQFNRTRPQLRSNHEDPFEAKPI